MTILRFAGCPVSHEGAVSDASRAGAGVDPQSAESVARTATAAAAAGLVLRFIDLERAAIHFFAVQRLHGASGIGVVHFNEAETTGTARVTIVDQRNLLHRAM